MNKTENQYFSDSKRYEDLTITDNFMFAKVMQNERLCKKFLELILHIRIQRIKYYNDEQSLKKFHHSKGIRLDVYLSDEKATIYNIEMQTTNKYNLPKRSRYYQGMIDLNLLDPGDDYNKLKRSYIIFVCTFDLFGKGRYIYTFENHCVEELDLVLPDEAIKVFINIKGTDTNLDEEFLELMEFFNGEQHAVGIAKEMQEEVDNIKGKEDWRAEYMTMMEIERERYREGIEHERQQSIRYFVKQALKYGADIGEIINDIMLEYDMTEEQVKSILDKE